jgi:hypothetical protein
MSAKLKGVIKIYKTIFRAMYRAMYRKRARKRQYHQVMASSVNKPIVDAGCVKMKAMSSFFGANLFRTYRGKERKDCNSCISIDMLSMYHKEPQVVKTHLN